MRSAHFDAAEARPVGLRAAVTSCVGACCGVPRRCGQHPQGPKAFASLIHDVETKIFGTLPDETWVYPWHGNDTSLGAERPHLPEWHARGW
ncbi:hypothetical protein GCM10010228_25910 [Streptomyces massasporeus]|nr:hypothetical protein GCM10010228_25910 [Streptomyces massasporeus]